MVGRSALVAAMLLLVPSGVADDERPQVNVTWGPAAVGPVVEAPEAWDCDVMTYHSGGYWDSVSVWCDVPSFQCATLTAALDAVAVSPSYWSASAGCFGSDFGFFGICSDDVPRGPFGLGVPRSLACERSFDVGLTATSVGCSLSVATSYGTPAETAGRTLADAGVQFLPGTGTATCRF